MAALTDRAPASSASPPACTLLLGAGALVGALTTDEAPGRGRPGRRTPSSQGAAETAQALGLLADRPRLHTVRHLGPARLQGPLRPPHHRHPLGRRHLLAARRPPLRPALLRRARGARPDLADGDLDPGHRRPPRPLRALPGQRARGRRGLAADAVRPQTGRPADLRLPAGAPLRPLVPGALRPGRPQLPAPRGRLLAQPPPPHRPDRRPGPPARRLRRPRSTARRSRTRWPTAAPTLHPLPAPILGHSDYQADPAFAEERANGCWPAPAGGAGAAARNGSQDSSGRSSA